MNTRWKFAAAVLGAMTGIAACAAGESSGKTGGTTMGTGGAQSSSTQTTTSSSSRTRRAPARPLRARAARAGAARASAVRAASAAPGFGGSGFGGAGGGSVMCGATEPLCGNGMVDTGEDCDGTNFGGKTCATVGPFGGGTLACNVCCHLIVSGCTPAENCTNGFDDNGDGLTDCMDPTCFGKPGCIDSCMPTFPGTLSDNYGDTTGRPHTHNASCSSSSPGGEYILQFTAPASGSLALDFQNWSFGANFSVSIRTTCADDSSEIACSSTPDPNTGDILLGAPVTAGQTYFLMVQGMTANDYGQFDLVVKQPPPEVFCKNLKDDDLNGYTDCDDPNCQAKPACVPGKNPTGSACTVNTDCSASANNPVCLDTLGFPGGYCSQWCSAANPCPSGDVCYTAFALSKDGVCLQGCTQASDCNTAAGYTCVAVGGGASACMLAETACNDYIDNNFNNLIDCQDPECQPQPDCTPGAGVVGSPCTLNNQCAASATANNPICLDQTNNMFPGGYCSHWCDPSVANDCGPLAICVPESQGTGNVCMSVCLTNAQCRPGYTCQNMGFSQKICHF